MTKHLAFDHDPVGVEDWLVRSARDLHPLQWVRELIVNAAEAESDVVFIDPWTDPDTETLCIRISDRGEGMDQDQLLRHMKTLRSSGAGRKNNHGIGARVATVGANPAGVLVASRRDNDETQVTMTTKGLEGHPDRGEVFYAYQPTPDILERVGSGSGSGTAVVLRGDGRRSSWSDSVVSEIRPFLGKRFWQLPAKVLLPQASSADRRGWRFRTAWGMRDRLRRGAEASGSVTVDDIGSECHWFVLSAKLRGEASGHTRPVSGIGLRVNNEIFGSQATKMQRHADGTSPSASTCPLSLVVSSWSLSPRSRSR